VNPRVSETGSLGQAGKVQSWSADLVQSGVMLWWQAGMYVEAMRAAVRVDNPQYAQRMLVLQASPRLRPHTGLRRQADGY
jgi:hypothetical protein